MMKGAIDFLLSDTREAKILRRKFIFRIIPMLNPDGVVYGNYRCSLLGVDLNRRWKAPNIHLHPTVYFSKKLIQMFSEEHEIAMYCDMHGHSMKKNVFMYACNYKSAGFGLDDSKTNIFIRLIPFLLSKRNRLFSYQDSHFRMEKFKESTARIVNFNEFNILASYTLEASFYGPEIKENEQHDSHMDTSDLESLGRDLCKQLMIFTSPKEFRQKLLELSQYLKAPCQSYMKRRAVSARRKERLIEEPEVNEIDEFSIKEAINEIPEENFEEICKPEEHSESGGSDAEASDNDDKKLMFLLEQAKKKKKKRSEKNKSLHVCQNRHSSNIRIRNTSLTPDLIVKSKSKSRISVIKNSYNSIMLKPPIKKILLKAPVNEEPSEVFTNFSGLDFKPLPEKQKKVRESVPIRTSRGVNGFIISSADVSDFSVRNPQKVYEKQFRSKK